MAERVQIPIVLLTGFLGSGKTTLLSRWLASPQFAGAMVIVNELGEVGLDHMLLETSSDAPLLLENGCACCSASDDLLSTLERLFWERLHKRIPRFEWVLIETTGIADPGPILEMLRSHQLIAERFRIAGVVTAFDVLRGSERLREFPECRRQLELASVVIVTKTDLAVPRAVEAARDLIARSAPGAVMLASAEGDLPAERLLAALGETVKQVQQPECAEGHAGCDGHHGPGGESHAHHSEGVSTAFLDLQGPLQWSVLLSVLPVFLEANRESLLRLKGAVHLLETGGYYAVQAMPGEAITRTPMPVAPAALKYRTGFTIIAHGIPAETLARDLELRIADTQAASAANRAEALQREI